METVDKQFFAFWELYTGYSYEHWLQNTGSIPDISPLEAFREGYNTACNDLKY